MERIASMDVLRGFAILVMFIDHILFLLGYSSFSMLEPRFFTRIAEPVFAVLFGYFLIGRSDRSFMDRFLQVAVAALLINLLVFPLMGSFEVLASFALCYLAFALLGEKIIYLIPLALLFWFDPTAGILAYPISLVLSQAALGAAIRKGVNPLVSLVFVAMSFLVAPRFEFSFLLTALACALLLIAEKNKGFSIPIIEYIGRRPLFFYTAQYLVVALLVLFARQYLAI